MYLQFIELQKLCVQLNFMKTKKCLNCERAFEGNFCPDCGQSASEKRISAHYILHDIPHSVFHIDRGFFYTFKRLFLHPGRVAEDYLRGKRVQHFRPFAYVMILTALSAFIVKLLMWAKERLVLFYEPEFLMPEKSNFFENYFSVFIFLMIPFTSLVTWLFFVRRKYNFWEHFIANTYVNAQLNFIWILLHFVNLVVIIFTRKYMEFGFSFFQLIFMMLFLYLYGSVFGHLMGKYYKPGRLILQLTVMNTVLYMVYATGFNLAGFMKFPWQAGV